MAEEKQFEEQLKKWLRSEGIYPFGTPREKMITKPCGYYEKRWAGGGFTKAGLPDMHIIVNGYSIELELKAPKGQASELQKYNIQLCKWGGSFAEVVKERDFEEIKKLVLALKELPPLNTKYHLRGD